MYVLVRKDLPGTQPAVQAGHALAEWCIRAPEEDVEIWDNHTLVYLGVDNESDLWDWHERFIADHIGFEYFKEPHYQSQLTAIAALDKDGKLATLLKGLDLL